ncbi:putative carbamoyl-phosphate synthase, small subunit [Ostertagia ostertagi]
MPAETNLPKPAFLLLEDGTFFKGKSFGASGTSGGELCFNTGMTGYQEVFTDPSYTGQILIMNNAYVGNYGVKDEDVESDSVKIRGLICKNISDRYSRMTASDNLEHYLQKNGIVAIHDVDTRALVQHVRSKGAMNCIISTEITDEASLKAALAGVPDMSGLELSSEISTKESYTEKLDKIFWPSSIAVFGPTTPLRDTPQATVVEPRTVYGISKYAGELWCQYYHQRYGLDVRSLRYPGLISWKGEPGGGTTDYAVEIYHKALEQGHYTSFLKEGTYLPMMYMDDSIRGTIELMEAGAEKMKTRMAYNISAMSFAPEEVAASIQQHLPDFKIDYKPDFRQDIADGWPQSIDDSAARNDWGWQHRFDLDKMTTAMLDNLKKK